MKHDSVLYKFSCSLLEPSGITFIILFGFFVFVFFLYGVFELVPKNCNGKFSFCVWIPPIFITLVSFFIGITISHKYPGGMEAMLYPMKGLVHSPIICFVGIVANYWLFFGLLLIDKSLKRNKKLSCFALFLIGMIVPILLNILFWASIDIEQGMAMGL